MKKNRVRREKKPLVVKVGSGSDGYVIVVPAASMSISRKGSCSIFSKRHDRTQSRRVARLLARSRRLREAAERLQALRADVA